MSYSLLKAVIYIYICIYVYIHTLIMQNQMEKKMENDMDTDIYIYRGLYKDYMSYSLNCLKGVMRGYEARCWEFSLWLI